MDVKKLIQQLEFSEETLAKAMFEQAKLLYEASRYRIRKLQDRLELEADYNRLQTEMSLRVRRKNRGDGRLTESYIKEQVAASEPVIEAKQKLDQAKVLEESAKLLVDAYQARGSMAKALVQLIGTEVAVESKMMQGELERMGVKRLKDRVQNQFQDG